MSTWAVCVVSCAVGGRLVSRHWPWISTITHVLAVVERVTARRIVLAVSQAYFLPLLALVVRVASSARNRCSNTYGLATVRPPTILASQLTISASPDRALSLPRPAAACRGLLP